MKIDLENILKTLGLPVGLVAVFSAVLGLIGISLGQVVQIAGALLCLPFAIALIIDVLKYTGVVNDSTSGKWSAALNLIALAGVATLLKFYPSFDFMNWDAQAVQILKALVLIFSYIAQLIGSKQLHAFYTQTFKIKSFSYSLRMDG